MGCCKMTRAFSFVAMIGLTGSLFIVEIVVGYVTNSMALVADSFHMLSDVVSLLVGFAALRISSLRLRPRRYTFGLVRAEVVGALCNAVFLMALCFSIFVKALKRIVMPESLTNPKLVLIAGGIGLLVNIIGLFLFRGHGHGHSHGGGGHGHSHGGGKHSDRHPDTPKTIDSAVSTGKICENRDIEKSDVAQLLMSEEKCTGEPVISVLPISFSDTNLDSLKKSSTVSTSPSSSSFAPSVSSSSSASSSPSPSSSSSLNIRAVYLHVLGDALGSVIVIISAVIVLYTKGNWTMYVDPCLSLIMVTIICRTTYPLLKESASILMQTAPEHMEVGEMGRRLVDNVQGVLGVHELHIWQLSGSKVVASVHVRCRSDHDFMFIGRQVKQFFHDEGIHSTTIQPEFIAISAANVVGDVPKIADLPSEIASDKKLDTVSEDLESLDCILKCGEKCSERTCCGNEVM